MFTAAGPKTARRSDVTSSVPLPTQSPEVPGLQVGFAQRGVDQGGDLVDFEVINGQRLVMMLLDVCGDHKTAASIGSDVQAAFRRIAGQLLSGGDINEAEQLSALTLELNRAIMESTQGVRCTAAFVACYAAETGALWYVNAGHTPALLHDGETRELGASGVPLGLFSHAVHDAQLAVLGPGSAFVLVSKGLTELRAGREEYGLGRVKEVVAARNRHDANQLCALLLDSAEQFARAPRFGRPHPHDRTVAALIRT